MSRLRAALGRLNAQFVRRALAHGVLGPAWLVSASSPLARVHGALWWRALPGLPRPVFVVLEALAWARWAGWRAWRASWCMTLQVAAEERCRRAPVLRRLLHLALGWSIPPWQAVAVGLHRPPAPGGPDPALLFVFDHEAAAWHRRCNDGPRDAAAGALLRDKHAFAQAARQAGLPVVPQERLVACRTGESLVEAAGALRAVFCKTRRGSAARGAFAAWRDGDGWRGRDLAGRALVGLAAVERAWRALLASDDVLLQPLLRDAPEVAAWHAAAAGAPADHAATIRVVTRRGRDGGVRCVAAWLELCAGADAGWIACPVDVGSGCWRVPGQPGLPQPARQALGRLARVAAAGTVLPDWPAMRQGSCAAHALLDGLWGVAWDWIPTPQGACLLEGNEHWPVLALQRETGPLLAEAGQVGRPPSSR